ncbi:MAG TPA: hypothetical protein ENN80_15330, partial [Candidatus Hydrogenedentes bacterium]|nr:hypothetical protein [Candidatus Hydrogenedentota bacterium]
MRCIKRLGRGTRGQVHGTQQLRGKQEPEHGAILLNRLCASAAATIAWDIMAMCTLCLIPRRHRATVVLLEPAKKAGYGRFSVMGAKRCLCLLGCCACLTTWAGPGEPVKLDVTRDIEAPEIAQHNATGDGLTDDTEALQAAIHHVAQAGGGTVALPAGTYRIAALEIGEGVRLVGEGPGKTVLRVFEGSPYALIALTGGSLELLSVYGTPTEDMSGDHWKVGAGGKGIGSTALPVHLIHVREAMHGALLRNVHALESRYDCLYVRGSKGLRVEGCLFNRAGRNVVSMVGTDEDFRFSDCTFGSLWGLYLFDIEPAGGPYVRNGVIERCTFDGREAGRMDTDT